MFNREKIKELEREIASLRNDVKASQSYNRDLERTINNYKDNLDYLLEKGVLSDPRVTEDLIICLKLGSNLRATKFLDPKEEKEETDHYLLHIFEIRR